MIKVLFLCTGNSCRSQMAEGLFNNLRKDLGIAFSAGVEKHGMNQRAIKVMQELGIDMSKHYSKLLSEITDQNFDYVFTVCSNADQSCPTFPGNTKVIHTGFDDPPALTKDMKDEEDILEVYRRVRDEIKKFISSLTLD